MRKFRFRSYLDQALFVLLIMAGATASMVLDVRAVASAMAAGKLGVATAGVVVATPSAKAASATQPKTGGTLLARLSR